MKALSKDAIDSYFTQDVSRGEKPWRRGTRDTDFASLLNIETGALAEGPAPRLEHLTRSYFFKNFKEALAFTNKVGEIAEELDHHPEILTAWGRVIISCTTHSAGGISELDLTLVRRIDQLAVDAKFE